jgi:hypothetical protein
MQAGYVFQFLWAYLGVALAFALICERLGKGHVTALVIFILFSGLDIVLFPWKNPLARDEYRTGRVAARIAFGVEALSV